MRDYHFTPESYLAMMREAVPGYDRMEDETVAATGAGANSVLELGIGTGETAPSPARHPEAKLIGIDGSPGMVDVARYTLPAHRVSVLSEVGGFLPTGPFDLVVGLAVHHLHADRKADLFRRIASVRIGGRFGLADVVTPPTPLSCDGDDLRSITRARSRSSWPGLSSGINPEVTWTHRALW